MTVSLVTTTSGIAAQSAAFAPSKETPGLVIGSLSRPADVFLPSWSCGRPAALDIHVISPLQQQTLSEASVTPGHALQVGVQRKLTSNLPACREAGVECIPIVAETLGGLAEDAIFTVRSLGRAIADRPAPWTLSLPPDIFSRGSPLPSGGAMRTGSMGKNGTSIISYVRVPAEFKDQLGAI